MAKVVVLAVLLVALVASIAWFSGDHSRQEELRLAMSVALVASLLVLFGIVGRRRLEREHEEALAAVSARIAAELAPPLGVIVGRVEQVLARTEDTRAMGALNVVLEEVERIQQILNARARDRESDSDSG